MDVVGRDEELTVLRTVLVEGAPGEPAPLPAAVVVEGEPGMGKTTLVRWAVDAARQAGYRVLTANPRAAEAQSSFVALGDLLGDRVDRLLASLVPPRRRALAVALLLEEPSAGPPEARTVGRAVLDVIRLLAADRRLLVAVDDVQWLDPDSSAAIGFALRRLSSEPVAVLLTSRIEEPNERERPTLPTGPPRPDRSRDRAVDSVGDLLSTELLHRERVSRLRLGPLSLGALHFLILDRLGSTLSRPVLRRLHELSGGNPFYALELATAYQRGLVRLEPGEPLPSNLTGVVRSRLRALPTETRTWLAAAAALSRPSLRVLERVAGSGEVVEAALDPAVAQGIVILDDEVRFAHPLLAAAAYGLLTEPERRRLHGRLATVVDEIEERARHLAASAVPPEAVVAEVLEAAAEAAFRRGATGAAAALAAQAGRFTPADDRTAAVRRAVTEAEYRFESGDVAAAERLLGGLVAETPAGPQRARLLSRLARYRHFADDVGAGVALLREALAEAGDEPALRIEIEEGLAWGLFLLRRQIPAAAEHARSAVRVAEALGDPAALAEALAAEGLTAAACGQPGRDALERAVSLEAATLHWRVLRHPSFAYGYWLTCVDELAKAEMVFEGLLRRAVEAGDESALPPIHNHLAMVACLRGAWSAAIRHADEAHALALQVGQRPSQAASLARRALAQARRGDVEPARTSARRSLEIAAGETFDPARPEHALARGGEIALWALGLLELSLGRYAEADRFLQPLSRALLEAGIREPGELRCLPDAIEALLGLGDIEAAEGLLGELEAIAGSSARPSALAAASHYRGRLLAIRGDLSGAVTALETALEHHARSPLRFEAARTLLALGELERRAKRKRQARERLSAALAEFEALGAALWAERARAELARLGGRTRATGLTETEERIARLVAEGRSNKEVAALLFVTPKTVETILTRIYAKLGVRSRAALAHRYAALEAPSSDDEV
ncbi:MAG: transcriptional regulator [Chloroflexota bacterium]|nr:MAG: transcriptional regulator [Chloroflexota bacterium]